MNEIMFVVAAVLSSAAPVSSVRTDSFQVTAVSGSVRFEMQDINVTADRMTYNGSTGVVTLEGTKDSPVTLRRTDGRPSELSARKITISAKGGKTKADGIQHLDIAPGSLPNSR